MKNGLLLIAALFYLNTCFAQHTHVISRQLTDTVTEKITVLRSDKNVRQGLYNALYGSQQIAIGQYDHNKKTGVWNFYDKNGVITQTYDYTQKQLLFEAPWTGPAYAGFKCLLDVPLSDSVKSTKPVKIGGRFYGYIPFLKPFKLPSEFRDVSTNDYKIIIELLVSPGGRLADYKAYILSKTYKKAVNMDITKLSDDDKLFIPATVNGNVVACRIMITCVVNEQDHLDFMDFLQVTTTPGGSMSVSH